MIKPSNDVNAPNTTLALGGVSVTVTVAPDQGVAAVTTQCFDKDGGLIRLPRGLPGLSADEKAVICKALSAAVEEACKPYLNRVLGLGV